MTLRGLGNAGPRGGQRGDVLVVFEVADDPRFERDGEDLYTEVLVSYPQLVLGDDVEVPAVQGRAGCAFLRGSRAGRCCSCAGAVSARNGGGIGDLHVRVQLWTPNSVTPEVEALLAQLATLQQAPEQARGKGFWTKMKEALGA